MSAKHAENCTCRYSQEHGHLIGAACVAEWGGAALAALNTVPYQPAAGPTHQQERQTMIDHSTCKADCIRSPKNHETPAAIKAQELNGTHLGQRVIVTEDGNSATGVLRDINHSANIITERSLGFREFETLGATWVELEFLSHLTIRVSTNASVILKPETADQGESTHGG